MDGFNQVWTSPNTLPTKAEIAAPADWVARVHRASRILSAALPAVESQFTRPRDRDRRVGVRCSGNARVSVTICTPSVIFCQPRSPRAPPPGGNRNGTPPHGRGDTPGGPPRPARRPHRFRRPAPARARRLQRRRRLHGARRRPRLRGPPRSGCAPARSPSTTVCRPAPRAAPRRSPRGCARSASTRSTRSRVTVGRPGRPRGRRPRRPLRRARRRRRAPRRRRRPARPHPRRPGRNGAARARPRLRHPLAVRHGRGLRPDGRYRRPFLLLDRDTVRQGCLAQGIPSGTTRTTTTPPTPAPGCATRRCPCWRSRSAGASSRRWPVPPSSPATTPTPSTTGPPTRRRDAAGDDGSLDVARLDALPPAVRRRVLRRAAVAAGSPARLRSSPGTSRRSTASSPAGAGQRALNLPGRVDVAQVGWQTGLLAVVQATRGPDTEGVPARGRERHGSRP